MFAVNFLSVELIKTRQYLFIQVKNEFQFTFKVKVKVNWS